MNTAKRDLRTRLRSLRRGIPSAQREAESAAACLICGGLVASEPASYAALPDELDLGALHRWLWASSRAVLLPRVVEGGGLAWHRLTSATGLRPGFSGIPEPDPSCTTQIDLPPGASVLVPGLAFTRDGRRLGQGGGYYDRLLAQRPDLRAIGVGFTCQLVEELPCEAHDRPLHGLVIAGDLVLAPR